MRQWKKFWRAKPKATKNQVFDKLENMVKARKDIFTQEGIDDILKKIDQVRKGEIK
ncbi:MAG: hypothetical protein AB1630_08710 [bacterium]